MGNDSCETLSCRWSRGLKVRIDYDEGEVAEFRWFVESRKN